MRLSSIVISNFRGFRDMTRIPIDDNLTAIIGRNDAGKSTILEALDIFFNSSKSKLDSSDFNVKNPAEPVVIGCEFDELPKEIVIDARAKTSLQDEMLLNKNNRLEIWKKYNKPNHTATILVRARHPLYNGRPLIHLKQQELRQIYISNDQHLHNCGILRPDLNSNPAIRQALRQSSIVSFPDEDIEIVISSPDDQDLYASLEKYFPLFALFRSDRSNTDDDPEIQDPMKVAIRLILEDSKVRRLLDEVKDHVQNAAKQIAMQTIDKVRSIDSEIANTLSPQFRSEPKWDSIFKLSLTGDDDVPLNRRGSGVRRLVLLGFFGAEAERKLETGTRSDQKFTKSVIYAIEEPETALHPDKQVQIINSLRSLSLADNTQVVITTHSPTLVGSLPAEALRYVHRDKDGAVRVTHTDPEDRVNLLDTICSSLGVAPHPRCTAVLYVEGLTDVVHLENIFGLLKRKDPNFECPLDRGLVIVALGGCDNLKNFATAQRAKQLQLPDFLLFDGDAAGKAKSLGSNAFVLSKKEIECYLPWPAVYAWARAKNLHHALPTELDNDEEILEVLRSLDLKESKLKRRLAREVWDYVFRIGDLPQDHFEEFRNIAKAIVSRIKKDGAAV